jgi:copper chaperone CopZ
MRQLFMSAIAVAAIGVLQVTAGDGKSGEIKGAHICCGQCVKIAKGVLEKVDGISDIKVDQKTKTATFTAKDKDAAVKAVAAWYDAGFAGTAKYGDASLTPAAPKQSNSNIKEITVKGVHVCCGQCSNAIKKVFSGAEVKFGGSGPQKDVTISGAEISPATVLQKLNEAGFNGKVEK